MLTLWGAILIGSVGSVPTMAALWALDRRRSRKRNGEGACATCGVSWADAESPEPYLIHGRLVCQPCASRAKRRIPWYLGFVGGATVFASTASFLSAGTAAAVLFPLGTAGVLTATAIHLMKAANREAQMQLARGDYPGLPPTSGTATIGAVESN